LQNRKKGNKSKEDDFLINLSGSSNSNRINTSISLDDDNEELIKENTSLLSGLGSGAYQSGSSSSTNARS
jgi:hypothetical protein